MDETPKPLGRSQGSSISDLAQVDTSMIFQRTASHRASLGADVALHRRQALLMPNAEHDDFASFVVDPIEHSVSSSSSAVNALEVAA